MRKKYWKRLTAVFLACCLIVSMAPAVLAAGDDADPSDDQNIENTQNDGDGQNDNGEQNDGAGQNDGDNQDNSNSHNNDQDADDDQSDEDNQDDGNGQDNDNDQEEDDWNEEDDQRVSLEFDDLREAEEGWTWYYTDEDLELSLNTAELDDLEYDLKYEWIFNWYNDSIDDEVEFNADLSQYITDGGRSLFISREDLPGIRKELIKESDDSTDMLQVHVLVWANDEELVASADTGVSLREARSDYYYPCEKEINLVAGWDFWLGDAFGAYVENASYPYGRYEYIQIKNVKVEAPGLSAVLPPVKVVTEEDDEGNIYYSLTAKNFAWGDSATVIITYDDPITEEEASYEVKVNVVDTVTNAYIDSNKTSNQVLPGETIELYANVEQQWDGGNTYLPGELEDEVILEWNVDGDNVTLSDEDAPQKVLVTAGDQSNQEALITVTVYAKDSDGNKGEKLASSEYSLWITDEYYEIQYTTGNEDGINILYPGHSSVIVPELYYYNSGETDGSLVQANWEWDYDDNALSVELNEQGGYRITRNANAAYETGLGLRAIINEDEEDIEVASIEWNLNDVNSEIWFEEPGWNDWNVMYTDSENPYTLQLNTEQLEGMKYQVEYQFVVWTEDGEEEVEIPNDAWSVDDDEISLKADEIYEALKDYVTTPEIQITLRAIAINDKTNTEVSNTEFSFVAIEPYFENWFTTEDEVWTTLVGVEDYTWVALDGAYYCADVPDGEYEALKMTGYEIEDPNILTIEPVEENGVVAYYKLIGKAQGETKVTISYIDYEGNEQKMKATVVVSDEDYYIDVTGDSNSILPGDSLTLNAYLYHFYVDENGNVASERLSDEAGLHCEWDFSWGNDEGLFELEPSKDTFSCTVNASKSLVDNYANGSIYCTVYDADENVVCEFYDYYVESTNDPYYDWLLSDNCWIDQIQKYYYLGYDNAVTFTVEDLVSHYVEDDGLTLTGITYRLLTDEDTDVVLNIAENGNGSYTVTRKADGETGLRIEAYRNKTWLAEYDVTFLDYSVYTVADHKVALCPGKSDTVNLSIHAGNYDPASGAYEEIEPWEVSKYEWLNKEDVNKLGADLKVTQSDDTASFTVSLAEGSTAKGNVTIELAAYLMNGTVLRQTVALGEFGGHTYVSAVVKEATATEDGLLQYTCTKCGDTYTEIIPKTGTPGNGTTGTDNTSGNGTTGTGNTSGNGTNGTGNNSGNGTSTNTTVGVKTGDNAPIWMLSILLVIALGGISGVVVYKRRVR